MSPIEIIIEPILHEDTLPIRHKVMWPDKPLEYVMLKDDERGIHFGLKKDSKLITVVSLFIKGEEAQFRKLATLQSEQGNGYASLILEHVIQYSKSNNVLKLWCNARIEKTQFYKRIGLLETNKTFSKGGVDYVIMENHL